jgi:hypothetical protein
MDAYTKQLIETAQRYAADKPLKITKFTGDVEIPRNLIVRVTGYLLNEAVQARLGVPGQKADYAALLKQEIEANPEMSSLYIGDGPQHGVKYYLSGTGAKELIASLRG